MLFKFFFLLFQLKKKKLSEVMVQCNLPYDKTNIDDPAIAAVLYK